MKIAKLLFLLLGLALLVPILREIDVREVSAHLAQVGAAGVLFVLALYVVTFLIDVVSWQLTFNSVPLTGLWVWRLYLVRMVGEAFNNVIPAASMGGEPLKAVLLKSHYGVGYREAGISLVLAKTINMIALILFLCAGFALLMRSPDFGSPYKVVAGVGLIALTVGTLLFFLVQRLKLSSHASHRLLGSRFGDRIERVLHVIRDIDEQMVRFYTRHHARFGAALLLALANWLIGIVEVYVVMYLLGHPVSLVDAWIIEAMAQLVRAGTFFIPASVGAQEGTFFVVCAAITGKPGLGVALSLVRRSREIVWILGGLLLWWLYAMKRPVAAATAPDLSTSPAD